MLPALRVDIHDLNKQEQEELIRIAVMNGFLRSEPEKAWTKQERKEAMRDGARYIIHRHFRFNLK